MDDTRARRMLDTRINACVMTHTSTYVWHLFMNVCVAHIHVYVWHIVTRIHVCVAYIHAFHFKKACYQHECMCGIYSCVCVAYIQVFTYVHLCIVFMYMCAAVCCMYERNASTHVYKDMNMYHTYIHTFISVHSHIPFIYTCIHSNCTDIFMYRCYTYTLACHTWDVVHCECVMSRIQTSHATHMRSSRTSVRAAMRAAFRTSTNESSHMYKRAMSCA